MVNGRIGRRDGARFAGSSDESRFCDEQRRSTMTAIPHPEWEVVGRVSVASPSYQAYRMLQVAFIVAPIVAGLDKFFHLLTDWSIYVSARVSEMVGGHVSGFMMVVWI